MIPVTLGVIVALFWIQRRGTEQVGRRSGPSWSCGSWHWPSPGVAAIATHPVVLEAINPVYAVQVLVHQPGHGAGAHRRGIPGVTGGEALYADMGHFGKQPVRVAWFSLVWPALLLNYYRAGRAASCSGGGARPCRCTRWCRQRCCRSMVVLATAATVIASQAVISGAFSVARQAIQLDLLPRMRILQTSAHRAGPDLRAGRQRARCSLPCCLFVLGFGSSDALAGAYGAAVVGTMFITTILGAFVAVTQWGWPPLAVGALFGLLLRWTAVFVAGNMTKIRPAAGCR